MHLFDKRLPHLFDGITKVSRVNGKKISSPPSLSSSPSTSSHPTAFPNDEPSKEVQKSFDHFERLNHEITVRVEYAMDPPVQAAQVCLCFSWCTL